MFSPFSFLHFQSKFHKAMETSQRVTKETANDDNRTISIAVESIGYLVELLNNSYKMMQDFGALAKTLEATNILTGKIIPVRGFFLCSKI